MNDEALKFYGYIDSLAKQIKVLSAKFTLSQAAHLDANPKSTLLKACRCLVMSSKKAFRSYPHDF